VATRPTVSNLCQAFRATAERRPDEIALRTLGNAVTMTWRAYVERVRDVAAGFHELGLRKGQTVALMLGSRPEFNIADAAALHVGAIPFSIYNTSAPEQISHLLHDADPNLIVAEPGFVDALDRAGANRSRLVLVDRDPTDELLGLQAVADEGRRSSVDVTALAHEISPDDVACLIYTSGTTGRPKGVRLTHANLISEVRCFTAVAPLREGARTVSYLPSAHIADRITTHYAGLMLGFEVTKCPDLGQLSEHLLDRPPHWFVGVPRVWEKIQAGIEAEIERAPDSATGRALRRGIAAGLERIRAASLRLPLETSLEEAWSEAESDVLRPLRQRLGLDALEVCIVGGAPTPVPTLQFFAAIGIELLEVWGMSETCGIGTVVPPGTYRRGTVGQPLPGTEMRLAHDGEMLIRGPNVTVGYHHQPQATREAFDGDGWFHTGDVGTVDDQGFFTIVDRKKELIINSAGKNMSPAMIESRVKAASPLIGQACVIGDARPYNTALIVLDPVAVDGFASRFGRGGSDLADLATDPNVQAAIADAVRVANERLSRVEQVKRWTVLPHEWVAASDELTPTMKLRRRPIAEKYAAEIALMYPSR
jgi:long-subunit acyl-CoA synthetase (AMP-forming)